MTDAIDYLNWSKILDNEINNDSNSSWYHPKGRVDGTVGVGHFDYGRMKFVNRNLNYFYFENMISLAVKNQYEYNKNYKQTLNFCNLLRPVLNESGPFGRMCIWKIPPKGYLLPHVDAWPYHSCIRRYIFCISDHKNDDATIVIHNKEISVSQGLLFQFHPFYQKHEFINHTNKNWYFLGFDYWNTIKLNQLALEKNINLNTEIYYAEGFGGYKSKCKYMSKE
jgi:hypothetical protein